METNAEIEKNLGANVVASFRRLGSKLGLPKVVVSTACALVGKPFDDSIYGSLATAAPTQLKNSLPKMLALLIVAIKYQPGWESLEIAEGWRGGEGEGEGGGKRHLDSFQNCNTTNNVLGLNSSPERRASDDADFASYCGELFKHKNFSIKNDMADAMDWLHKLSLAENKKLEKGRRKKAS